MAENSFVHQGGGFQMRKTSILFGAAALALFATAAFAQDLSDPYDPALFQNGTNCSGTYWCASDGQAANPDDSVDPPTLEFIISTPPPGTGISFPWAKGWVADKTTGGATADLLDFTTVTVNGKASDAVFLYCNPLHDQCSSLDSGLPTITPTIGASFTLGSIYAPTSSQPGYATATIAPGTTGVPTYAIIDTPEPSAVLLLSFMLIGLGVVAGRKISASS
jgi:hypothetical protein